MRQTPTARAVFLDRDGVLNRNIFYQDTQAFESPREPHELALTAGLGAALRRLQTAGFLLILVSNQPNAAKGKCSRQTLDRIHARLLVRLAEEGVSLAACYYCYHHPEHTGPCACRKPSPYFLAQACARFGMEPAQCWMIGDRPSDIACGRAAGVRTIWINTREGMALANEDAADLSAGSVADAVPRLLAASSREMRS